jgi:hypothetical protein
MNPEIVQKYLREENQADIWNGKKFFDCLSKITITKSFKGDLMELFGKYNLSCLVIVK